MGRGTSRLEAEVFKGRDGWRWRLRGRNGEVVPQSQRYSRKHDAKRGVQRVAPEATLTVHSKGVSK